MTASGVGRPASAAKRGRHHGLLWSAVVVPCAVLIVTGLRLMAREQELRVKREADARSGFAADASRAIVEQLRGIVLAEAVALESPEYVEGATVLAGRLTRHGLALPWNGVVGKRVPGTGTSILRRRALSPDACRAAVRTAPPALHAPILGRCDELDRAVRLAADTVALAAVRGAFGEPRIVAWDEGRWLVAMGYVDAGNPVLVAVRIPDLVRAAGAGLGDSVSVVATSRPGAIPLTAGLDGLWLSWTGPPTARAFWSGRQVYLAATLVIVLGIAVLAAFLLSRDVRREMQLAHVRQQFVASVSHELRTPLTAIRMYAETLRERPLDGSARDEYLDTIIGESARLSRLVDDILDFSRAEHGQRAYRLRDADLEATVRRAIDTLRRPIEQQGFSVRMTTSGNPPAVRIDADAIGRAVLNLVGNAMKYSGEAREIEVSVGCDGGEATVRVRDHGVGVPPAERERIFDEFHRVPDTASEATGTGLGLTLVRHTVTAHGGRVSVEEAPGGGSVFALHLPVRPAP